MGYRKRGTSAFVAMKPGDLIAVKPSGGGVYALRNIPEVSGGMVVESPHSGRIYAMQGGFDVRLSSFNRVTQAERQPGSTIKHFVEATAPIGRASWRERLFRYVSISGVAVSLKQKLT